MTCQCISPECPARHHVDLECKARATRRVQSRDWDGASYAMCHMCGASAVVSGMFAVEVA